MHGYSKGRSVKTDRHYHQSEQMRVVSLRKRQPNTCRSDAVEILRNNIED